MITIKKYSNRRLYDTSRSQYITLDELATLIRDGEDVQVQDAKSGEDLTQAVLAQIIIESRGAAKLLPTSMLTQLIRMEEDALAEFFSYYMSWSLSFYLKAKARTRRRFSSLSGAFSPFGGSMPGESFAQWFQAMNAWNPMGQNQNGWQGPPRHGGAGPEMPPPPPFDDDVSHPEEDEEMRLHGEPDYPTTGQRKPSSSAQKEDGEVTRMRQELDEIKALLGQLAGRQAGPDKGE